MLTAICMNPAIDRTVTVPSLQIGAVNRIASVRHDVGGKGVNVAITAKRLGVESFVLGCAGKEGMERVINRLSAEKIDSAFLPLDGSVRTNTKIVALQPHCVTELNEQGAPMNAQQMQEFLAMAEKRIQGSDYVVLTGSLPPNAPKDTYRALIECLPECRCVLDSSGETLLQGLKAHPFLIKPNQHELHETLGCPCETLAQVREAAKKLIEMGTENVLVSLGADGAMWVTWDAVMFAPAMPVTVSSTVGAGDAMVGGVMAGFIKTGDIRQAFAYGVAAGSATVMTEGTQLIRPDVFETLLPQVKIQDV